MNHASSWQDILTGAESGDHIAQLYQDVDFLAEALDVFIGAGLRGDEAIVVVAKETPWKTSLRRLETKGFNPEQALERGQLVFFDVEKMLSKFMIGGMPDWDCFKRSVGGVLDRMEARYPAVRVHGEMVNVLWQKGRLDAAIALEDHWNELGRSHRFSLFCVYLMDNLEKKTYEGPLQGICRTHSHIIPTRDYPRFEEAVNQAVRQALGPSFPDTLRVLATDSTIQMPDGQAMLLWLRQNIPYTADKVLSCVRSSK
jgi:hypothetical protein